MFFLSFLLAGAALQAGAAILPPPGQSPTLDAAASAPLHAPLPVIPALTVVDLEITMPINSKTAQIGTLFNIRLIRPILVNGVEVVPMGTTGIGEIVHAAKARAGGKPGELILAARYLDFAGARLPLRSLKLGGNGDDRTGLAFAVGVAAGVAAYLVTGGEIDIPAGSAGVAKTAADFPAPRAPSAATTTP
jgi:hypothetical protein